MLKPIHIEPEPVVCRTFGCGRRLTYTEQLYGGRCLACSGDKKETILNYKKMEDLFTPGCIRTFTGEYIDVSKPDPDKIHIEDIAHALSMQPRFGGHLPVWYSVAEHCYHASFYVDPGDALDALMHDSSEAYLIDVPKPVKEQLPNYKELESGVMAAIAFKFGISWPLTAGVKKADAELLQAEWDCIMLKSSYRFFPKWDQATAKRRFIDRYNQIITDNQINGI